LCKVSAQGKIEDYKTAITGYNRYGFSAVNICILRSFIDKNNKYSYSLETPDGVIKNISGKKLISEINKLPDFLTILIFPPENMEYSKYSAKTEIEPVYEKLFGKLIDKQKIALVIFPNILFDYSLKDIDYVFIAFRSASELKWDYYLNGEYIGVNEPAYKKLEDKLKKSNKFVFILADFENTNLASMSPFVFDDYAKIVIKDIKSMKKNYLFVQFFEKLYIQEISHSPASSKD
jgi:hypothetical protein